jgi:hypothetical protein
VSTRRLEELETKPKALCDTVAVENAMVAEAFCMSPRFSWLQIFCMSEDTEYTEETEETEVLSNLSSSWLAEVLASVPLPASSPFPKASMGLLANPAVSSLRDGDVRSPVCTQATGHSL